MPKKYFKIICFCILIINEEISRIRIHQSEVRILGSGAAPKLVRGTDPGIRIRTKMSWIPNTAILQDPLLWADFQLKTCIYPMKTRLGGFCKFCPNRQKHALSLKSTAARSIPNAAMFKARGFTPRAFKARAWSSKAHHFNQDKLCVHPCVAPLQP